MENFIKIETYSLKTKTIYFYFLGLISLILVMVFLSILISKTVSNNVAPFIIIFGILLFLLPLIFLSKKSNWYAKKATVKIDDKSITIDIFNKRHNSLKVHTELEFCEILFFKVSEENYNNTSNLKLYMKDGSKLRFSFFEQNQNDENIVSNVISFFKTYNLGRPESEKINLLPNLYITRIGKFFIVVLTCLIIVAVFLLIFIKPESIPFTLLIGIFFFVRIKEQQKKDFKLYNSF